MPVEEADLEFLLDKFLQMIAAFQAQAAAANNLLREHLGLENPMYWRQAEIAQIGCCGSDRSIWYFYHGIGRRVVTKDFSIDWDYGYEGRVDGFDLWRLKLFAEESASSFSEFKDTDALEAALQEAINRQLIHQPFLQKQDNLFYLSSVY